MLSHKEITTKNQKLIDELNSFCEYNSETGQLILIKHRKYINDKVGQTLGSLVPQGYLRLKVNNKSYRVHRLIWLLAYGEFPTNGIDHKDGNKLNNRLDNLRNATAIINGRNCNKNCNNISGVTGVHWHKEKAKWIANIKLEGKTKHLGSFHDKNLAIKYRKEAEIKYGFTKRHGL